MTITTDPPIVTLAGLLADGTYDRALDLAAADTSPLRSAVGGRGSSGDHSDPTANAQQRRHCPHPVALMAALQHLAYACDAPAGRHADHHWVAGKLIGIHQLGMVTTTQRKWIGDLLTLINRCVTPAEAAAWAIAKAEERIVVAGPDSCEACETPRQHAGRLRHGWCDPCTALHRRWQQSDARLLGDSGRAVFATQVAQAISAGTIRRPRSPHRPGASIVDIDVPLDYGADCQTDRPPPSGVDVDQ